MKCYRKYFTKAYRHSAHNPSLGRYGIKRFRGYMAVVPGGVPNPTYNTRQDGTASTASTDRPPAKVPVSYKETLPTQCLCAHCPAPCIGSTPSRSTVRPVSVPMDLHPCYSSRHSCFCRNHSISPNRPQPSASVQSNERIIECPTNGQMCWCLRMAMDETISGNSSRVNVHISHQ